MSQGRYVTVKPSDSSVLHELSTALCSIEVVIMWHEAPIRFFLMLLEKLLIAQLSDSEPPLVKYISSGRAPISLAA